MLTLPGKSATSGVNPYRPLTPGNLAPLTTATNAPARAQSRDFNLDTAVGRILADLRYVAVVGEFELAVTNGTKVTVAVTNTAAVLGGADAVAAISRRYFILPE